MTTDAAIEQEIQSVILGVLCWRSTPDGEWTEYTAHQLTRKLLAAEKEVEDLRASLGA